MRVKHMIFNKYHLSMIIVGIFFIIGMIGGCEISEQTRTYKNIHEERTVDGKVLKSQTHRIVYPAHWPKPPIMKDQESLQDE